jgi:hypothetical protein
MRDCKFYIEKNTPWYPVPYEVGCCEKVRQANVTAICQEFTEQDKEKISLPKWVKVTRVCGHALLDGVNCSGYIAPPSFSFM